ncbi:gamma-glutamylcyclotransferase family protein [Pseudomaricurvus sp. HS19]|uniref:gamma-glutamylcyclotransferase family protein n=1 Tax=Pseudomaricurvus sp. HS19 TaxID=2692626 RepID=UPI00192545D8|nr:gamma-glutamylcyclotransferase family protein [Pseudomaricurvus sp. HS19]
MSLYYFAYGSNMNQARMVARGLEYRRALAGRLPGLALAFNKQASDAPHRAYANVVYAPGRVVEGVLYELASLQEIRKMDPFEGAPRRYSREIYHIHTDEGEIPAWVYVANPAMLRTGLMPETWYLQHLLAGSEFLTEEYRRFLAAVECRDQRDPVPMPACMGRNS